MALFKLKKACHGKEPGEYVNMTDQRACLLMRTGYVKIDSSLMKKFGRQITKAEKKETAVSKKQAKKETGDNKTAGGK